MLGYSEEAEIFGIFDPLLAPSPATVAQVQDLRLAGTVRDEGCNPPAVNGGDSQLAARRGLLDPDDHPPPGGKLVRLMPYSPALPVASSPVISAT